jgi:hypothetical protein
MAKNITTLIKEVQGLKRKVSERQTRRVWLAGRALNQRSSNRRAVSFSSCAAGRVGTRCVQTSQTVLQSPAISRTSGAAGSTEQGRASGHRAHGGRWCFRGRHRGRRRFLLKAIATTACQECALFAQCARHGHGLILCILLCGSSSCGSSCSTRRRWLTIRRHSADEARSHLCRSSATKQSAIQTSLCTRGNPTAANRS